MIERSQFVADLHEAANFSRFQFSQGFDQRGGLLVNSGTVCWSVTNGCRNPSLGGG